MLVWSSCYQVLKLFGGCRLKHAEGGALVACIFCVWSPIGFLPDLANFVCEELEELMHHRLMEQLRHHFSALGGSGPPKAFFGDAELLSIRSNE